MKRILPFLLLAVAAMAPATFAQDHAEVGAYGDFFRLNDANINFGGLGGRASFNLNPYVQLEAEMTYDFARAFGEAFSNGSTVTVVDSNVRLLHGLVGPKLETNRGPVRLFVTAKGGFLNFMFDRRPPSFDTFTSSVENLRSSNVNGVFYPGAGAEAFLGPIGLRLDVGDEIYFRNGAHNNLRISFGPTIRF
jgi:hypothetical protein